MREMKNRKISNRNQHCGDALGIKKRLKIYTVLYSSYDVLKRILACTRSNLNNFIQILILAVLHLQCFDHQLYRGFVDLDDRTMHNPVFSFNTKIKFICEFCRRTPIYVESSPICVLTS